uniref:Uncharacterized protein n=1 Tax=Arundo donax TaxID=35708 RepID=A0A0A8ZNU2_ARUDO
MGSRSTPSSQSPCLNLRLRRWCRRRRSGRSRRVRSRAAAASPSSRPSPSSWTAERKRMRSGSRTRRTRRRLAWGGAVPAGALGPRLSCQRQRPS